MISIELMAIMAIIGYMAFVFIAESFNPFFISRRRRKRVLHAVGIMVAAMIASSPLVLHIWPKTNLREQLSLILLVLLASLACLIVLYSIYYLYSRLFTQEADTDTRGVLRTESESTANLLTNKAGAPTKINHDEDTAEPNTPPIEINADRMFDANLEAALESADADLKIAKANDTMGLSTQLRRPEALSVNAKTDVGDFTHTDGVIVEAEWSEPVDTAKGAATSVAANITASVAAGSKDDQPTRSEQRATFGSSDAPKTNAALASDVMTNRPAAPVSASSSAVISANNISANKHDTVVDATTQTPAAPITTPAKHTEPPATVDAIGGAIGDANDIERQNAATNLPSAAAKDTKERIPEPVLSPTQTDTQGQVQPQTQVQTGAQAKIQPQDPVAANTSPELTKESMKEPNVEAAGNPTPEESGKTADDSVQANEIAAALSAIKGKTTQLRSTIEQVSDQQIIGQQTAASLKKKQQEQLSIQRREINRQAHQVRELESREQQRTLEMNRLDKLHNATDSLLQAQRDQLEEARHFRAQAERLLTAREQALQSRERAIETQRHELEKSRSVAKKAALAARKAALAHQQVKISMLREQVARNKTEKRAQKAVLIAKDAISRLANEEQRNKNRSTT